MPHCIHSNPERHLRDLCIVVLPYGIMKVALERPISIRALEVLQSHHALHFDCFKLP